MFSGWNSPIFSSTATNDRSHLWNRNKSMKYSRSLTSSRYWLRMNENMPPISQREGLDSCKDRLFKLPLTVFIVELQEVESILILNGKASADSGCAREALYRAV